MVEWHRSRWSLRLSVVRGTDGSAEGGTQDGHAHSTLHPCSASDQVGAGFLPLVAIDFPRVREVI
jgi:hypothetical protein